MSSFLAAKIDRAPPLIVKSQIAHKCGCDIFGLDGALDFQVGRAMFYGPENRRIVFEGSVMPMLEAYYGMPSRRIDEYEFWLLNPQRKLDT